MRGGSGWQCARYDAIEVGRAGSSGSERQGGGRRAEHSTLMTLREEAKMFSGSNQGQSGEIDGDRWRSMEIAPA
jgi:hypothetical protein